jgi:hypothetical protein
MSTAVKRRRGTTAQHTAFTGQLAEVTVDTDKNTLVVHDGVTAGGFPLARESLLPIHATSYGVKADGATDDTANLQAAVNAAFVLSGRKLVLPRGTIKLTAAITIPFATGWVLGGDSRGNTILKQFTSNTPILQFTTALTHSWEIRDIGFDYSVQQAAANTLAIPVYFDLVSGSGPNGYFNMRIDSCTFSNCFRSIGSKSTAGQIAVWGLVVQNCTFGGTRTGAALHLVPNPSIGQPRICMRDCYFDSTAVTESEIVITAGDNVHLQGLEFNNGTFTNFGQIFCTSCAVVTMLHCKAEAATFGNGAPGMLIWNFSQSNVSILGCNFLSCTVVAGSTIWLVSATEIATIGGKINVNLFRADMTLGGGAICYAFAGDLQSVAGIELVNAILSEVSSTNPRLNLSQIQPNLTALRGDVALNLTVADKPCQVFNTTLTADRTVVLPNTGLYDGLEFLIVRRAATPGNYVLIVNDPVSGKSYQILQNLNGFCRWRASSGSEWQIVEQGAIAANTPKVVSTGKMEDLVRNTTTIRNDTAVALTATDSRIQYFQAALTANRQVTLPNTGLVDGLEFTIVRWGLGAFDLNIVDPVSGKNTSMTGATKRFVTYRAVGTAEWLIIDYGTLP